MVSYGRGLTLKLATPFFDNGWGGLIWVWLDPEVGHTLIDNEWAWFFDEMGNEEVLFVGVAWPWSWPHPFLIIIVEVWKIEEDDMMMKTAEVDQSR